MRKIEYAVGAAGLFIKHMHIENVDRGMIATFGNAFRVEQGFTGREIELHHTLAYVSRSVTDEQTRLYDSIEDVINQFWHTGDRGRPWLLVVITDGQDNISRRYWDNPRGIGNFIGQRFNHEPSNFIFVIGVGEGEQIGRAALGKMGDSGQFTAMTIAAFPLLELVFLELAFRISETTVGQVVTSGNRSWGEVARLRQISHIPFDYAFLIDRSGSMSEQG